MTSMTDGPEILRADVLGRVKTPLAKRREILDEFEKSGLTGARFAALAGIKYQTFASWVQERRRERGAGGPGPTGKQRKEVRFLEAMVEKAAVSPAALEVELPGGVRLRISDAGQIPLAVQLIRSLASC